MWNSGVEGAHVLDAAALNAVQAAQQQSAILCYQCGIPVQQNLFVEGSTRAICLECIRATTDITDGILREGVVHCCRGCNRYLQPPDRWLTAERESRELLAVLLRKVGKLTTVRLIDAQFIWTEPHSKRIKMSLTVEKEVKGVILQQTFTVEFVVANQQCRDCAKTYTPHTWHAVVQVRQHVNHKKTFLYLEQLILKHNAHFGCINVKDIKDGMDFFWGHNTDAIKFVEFINNVLPIQQKASEELISADIKSNTAAFKFSYSIEIPPICREDLLCLPKQLAKKIGNISQLVVCLKINSTIRVVDPITLQTADISSAEYWRYPFISLADHSHLVEFDVLNVEILNSKNGKLELADIEVMRTTDMVKGGTSHIVRSHLGSFLHAGDVCLGYYLIGSNFNNDIFDSLKSDYIPDVVLIKRLYPKRNKTRNWKIKTLAKEEPSYTAKKQEVEKREKEYEQFLQELEEDAELRQTVNLFKSSKPDSMQIDDDDIPKISIDELLDDLEDLEIS